MAISWLSALKLVPWTEVISNAPLVADGAKKLWGAVVKPTSVTPAAEAPSAAAEHPAQALAEVQHEVLQLKAAVTDLHSQMLACTALIQDLAAQNTQLIAQVQASRLRLRWLGVWLALLVLVALATGGSLLLGFWPRG